MQFKFYTATILFFWGVLVFLSCKKELSCEACAGSNKSPVAVAGPDQIITLPKDSVLLDGSTSLDADGQITKWQWKKIAGPSSSQFANSAAAITVVKVLVAGVYHFELIVTDNGGLSAKDTVQVIVDNGAVNQPPVACAGADINITLPTNSFTLNGSCSADPEGNIVAYQWSKISGPSSLTITDPTAAQTQVSNLVEGVYQFELKVTESGGLFSRDTIQVSVMKETVAISCSNINRPEIPIQLIPVGTLSKERDGMALVSAGNKIFFAGGYLSDINQADSRGMSRVDIYDISENSWSTTELSVPRGSITTIAADNKIFFAGGWSGEIGMLTFNHSTVDIYDLSTNTWSVTNMSEAKYNVAAAVVDNKVFFAGGTGIDTIGNMVDVHFKDKVEIYDVNTNSWSVLKLSEAKTSVSAVTINNRIYFAGGSSIHSPNLSSRIEIYDNISGIWEISNLNEAKYTSGIAVGNKIYYGGGWNGNFLCKVEIFDVSTRLSSFDALSEPAFPRMLLKDNKMLYYNKTNRFDVYDITSNTWSIGVLPASAPTELQLISVNNTIYAAGGGKNVNGIRVENKQVYKLEF